MRKGIVGIRRKDGRKIFSKSREVDMRPSPLGARRGGLARLAGPSLRSDPDTRRSVAMSWNLCANSDARIAA